MRQRFVQAISVRLSAVLLCAGLFAVAQSPPDSYYKELLSRFAGHFGECLQPAAAGVAHSTNVAIVLDASGPTQAHVAGGTTLDVLRAAAGRFAAALPPTTNLAIIVYGHRGDMTMAGKDASCHAVETIYPAAPYRPRLATPALDALKPGGWTPLKGAIEVAGDSFAGVSDNFTDNVIYVLAAGMDTCGGRAVESARLLHADRVRTTIHVVSIGTSKSEQEELRSVAQSGGGVFTSVQGAADLEKYLNEKARSIREVHRQNRLSLSCMETRLTEERSSIEHEMGLNTILAKDTTDAVNTRLAARQTRIRQWIDASAKRSGITPELLDKELAAIR